MCPTPVLWRTATLLTKTLTKYLLIVFQGLCGTLAWIQGMGSCFTTQSHQKIRQSLRRLTPQLMLREKIGATTAARLTQKSP